MYKYPFYLLKTRRFLPFFVTQFFGALNDNVFKLSVLTLIAFHLTDNPSENQFYQALGAGLFSLPFLLLSGTAGELADKYDKTFLMRIIKCVEVCLMIFGAVAIYAKNITAMLAIVFLMGVHSAFFGPLKYAILPEHLKKKEWLAGNAFVEAGTFVAILIGVLLGSMLIPEQAALLEHGLFLAGSVAISIAVCGALGSFFIPSMPAANPTLTMNKNFLGAMSSVMRESKKYPFVLPAIIGISWFWFVGATFLTEFPTYVEYTLHAEKSVFTLFLALFTIGIALGSLLCTRWLKGKISAKHVFLAIWGMTIFTVDVYFQSPAELTQLPEKLISLNAFFTHVQGWRISIDFFLLAICGGIYIVPLYAIIQKHSPMEWLSRMISANNIMNALFMVLSAAWIAILSYFKVSVATVFLTLALWNIFFAMYLLRLSKNSGPNQVIKTGLKYVLICLYRVKIKGIKNKKAARREFQNFQDTLIIQGVQNQSQKPFILLNETSLLDYLLLAVFFPDFREYTLIFDQKIPAYLLKLFPMKVISRENLMQTSEFQPSEYQQVYILPIQIKGALFLPFSSMKGKVPKRWFPKIKLVIHPLMHVSANSLESVIIKQTNEMMFQSMPWKRSLFSALLDMAKIHKKRPIAGDIQQNSMSYSDIVTRSFILGSLMKKNTTEGEYVGVLMPTMVNSMICFFAIQAFGRIPAMLNYSIGARRLKATCLLANLKTVYTSRIFIAQANLEDLIEALLELNINIIYLEDYRKKITFMDKMIGWSRGFVACSIVFNLFKRLSTDLFIHTRVKSTDPAVVLFTSGSEGLPKGVVLSHRNLLANTYQMSTSIDVTTDDCLFNALPIFHCFGLTTGMLLPMINGFSVFFYPSPLHYRLIPEWVAKTKATLFLATDTFLKGYGHYANIENFKTVRCIFAGAEKVKEETIKKWKNSLDTLVFEGYGVTETAPVIAVNTEQRNKMGTVGCLLPGIQYQLEPFENLENGGRLWVSGPNVMMGYLEPDNPGVIKPLEKVFHDTGDIASVDEEGYLILLGRAKRFAKIGGEMVSFSAVESAVTTLWPEHLHAIVSITDDKKGEQLVLLTDCPDAKREHLVRGMNEQGYSELFIPKRIDILSEIPVLGSGKIDYAALGQYTVNMDYAAALN